MPPLPDGPVLRPERRWRGRYGEIRHVSPAPGAARRSAERGRPTAAGSGPASVQPCIDAMRSTGLVAEERCFTKMATATSYAQARQMLIINSWCVAAHNDTNADQIRTLLHLPARQ